MLSPQGGRPGNRWELDIWGKNKQIPQHGTMT